MELAQNRQDLMPSRSSIGLEEETGVSEQIWTLALVMLLCLRWTGDTFATQRKEYC